MIKSYSVTVGTTSTIILPKLSFGTAPDAWEAAAYDAGTYVTASNGRIYWTPNGGGISITEPNHLGGIEEYDVVEVGEEDDIKWMALPTGRKEVVIAIDDDADAVYVRKSADAEVGESLKLRDTLPARNYYGYIGEINAIVESGTAVVTVEYE